LAVIALILATGRPIWMVRAPGGAQPVQAPVVPPWRVEVLATVDELTIGAAVRMRDSPVEEDHGVQ
jgi:hypothetical protein